jgi:purine-nucleoside phosphorylase
VRTHVGSVVSTDLFYSDLGDSMLKLGTMGVLAVEMEAAALYYLGAKHSVKTLGIMTISDSLVTGEETTAAERQTTFTDMMKVGLATLRSAG